jgi:hypothetical protein
MEASLIREREHRSASGRDNLFLWTILLLGLAGVAFACWLGSFYVFGHPEQPRSYRILRKLNKLPPPTRFLVTKAPPGDFLDAQKIFERYSKFTQLQMERENQLYVRNYIKNYSETKKLVPYLTGKFQVLSVYELRPTDFFPSGIVALTQAMDFPQVLVELVYTANAENLDDVKALLRAGVEVRLDRTLDLSAVVNVGRAQDGKLQLTVVPLLYGQYALKNGLGSFSLEPPKELNVGAGLPLVRAEEVRSVFREQAEQRKRRLAVLHPPEPQPSADSPEVVRMDPPKPSVASETPTAVVTPPLPVASEPAGLQSGKVTVAKASGINSKAVTPEAKTVPTAGPSPATPAQAVVDPRTAALEKNRSSKNNLKLSETGAPPKVLAVRPGGGEAALAQAKPTPGSGSASGVPNAGPQARTTVGGRTGKTEGAEKMERKAVEGSTGGMAAHPPAASGAVAAKPGVESNVGPREQAPPRVSPVASGASAAGPSGASTGLSGSPLVTRPVVVATPSLTAVGRPESWRTYSAGKQPQGRSVSLDQAVALRGRNDGSPVYLRGKFLVTAADRNQAVMRQESNEAGAVPTRVIVEYPAGAVPPARGASVLRGEGKGFEIREVRRGADGQVNIFVREVFSN